MNYKIYFWGLFVASLVLFFAPISISQAQGFGLDKVVHFGLFFALHFLVIRCYPKQHKKLILYLAAYVVVVEFVQGSILDYRAFELLDMVFGILGLLASHLFDNWKSKKSKRVIDPSTSLKE